MTRSGKSLLPKDLIQGSRREILEALVRHPELACHQLAGEVGKTYMGTKNQCDFLSRAGYLVVRRQEEPQRGRPELLYSLSERARAIFPQQGFSFAFALIEDAGRLFGPQAPRKLLFLFFQSLEKRYKATLQGTTPEERAQELALLRSTEGYGSAFFPGSPAVISEGLDPLEPLHKQFPETIEFETTAISRALGATVERQSAAGGHVRYLIKAPAAS